MKQPNVAHLIPLTSIYQRWREGKVSDEKAREVLAAQGFGSADINNALLMAAKDEDGKDKKPKGAYL